MFVHVIRKIALMPLIRIMTGFLCLILNNDELHEADQRAHISLPAGLLPSPAVHSCIQVSQMRC